MYPYVCMLHSGLFFSSLCWYHPVCLCHRVCVDTYVYLSPSVYVYTRVYVHLCVYGHPCVYVHRLFMYATVCMCTPCLFSTLEGISTLLFGTPLCDCTRLFFSTPLLYGIPYGYFTTAVFLHTHVFCRFVFSAYPCVHMYHIE